MYTSTSTTNSPTNTPIKSNTLTSCPSNTYSMQSQTDVSYATFQWSSHPTALSGASGTPVMLQWSVHIVKLPVHLVKEMWGARLAPQWMIPYPEG